ncbi:DUF1206 domain-containing protein [Pelagicoccus albus]|uniref:DUF1206 domain-containing protein n=1 Tax=Pelagicoccus albus TaxID=415222 RepID=A0A7X1B970_9BACT|nr:DUF1206 domain-containing protein [Pelagicoccus albus]MBC2606690.1 DUF1206 domain-containing protein [Pelagicoccus albus]
MSSLATDIISPKSSKTTSSNGPNHEAPGYLVVLAKAGYAARGLIYLIIGALAFLQATGHGGEKTDSKGAVQTLLEAPGGSLLIWILAASLLGYSTWRLVQAVTDADRHGRNGKALTIRAGLLISATTHLILAYSSVKIALNLGGSSGGSSESLVATVMSWPGGPWIVALIGLGIAVAGVAHTMKALEEKYKEHLKMDKTVMRKLNPICKFGLITRGFSFIVLAGMFLFASVTQDADEAGGLKDVLITVSDQVFGPCLLGFLGIGLFAFGIYSLTESVYRKIRYNS